MNGQYAEIKAELELTKKELLSRLMQSTNFEVSQEFLFQNQQSEKEKIVINHIKEDLNDVIKDYPDAQQVLRRKARLVC